MNKSFPNIITAFALDNYQILVSFEDGINGKFDVSDIERTGIMEFWNNIDNFKKLEIIDNKIIWNNEIDMDSNSIYLNLINKSFFEYARD